MLKFRNLAALALLALASSIPFAVSAQEAPAPGASTAASPAAAPGAPAAPAESPAAAKTAAPAARRALKKARVLVDCSHGECNEVVELPADVIAVGVKSGQLDDDKDAVAYAETLAKPKKAKA